MQRRDPPDDDGNDGCKYPRWLLSESRTKLVKAKANHCSAVKFSQELQRLQGSFCFEMDAGKLQPAGGQAPFSVWQGGSPVWVHGRSDSPTCRPRAVPALSISRRRRRPWPLLGQRSFQGRQDQMMGQCKVQTRCDEAMPHCQWSRWKPAWREGNARAFERVSPYADVRCSLALLSTPFKVR
ncbi:hypothetical protein BRADI_1g77507v3 [Brachypodium distachyon]|uniref:Uncharacterized protein n=1 Tax=Brachypodium distachyon TaxID=15368 RepID=A0A2K2DVM2_BRADI|nr:hypothetical protein BRADI_1g77507v3 [Brachypodium distachyon]